MLLYHCGIWQSYQAELSLLLLHLELPSTDLTRFLFQLLVALFLTSLQQFLILNSKKKKKNFFFRDIQADLFYIIKINYKKLQLSKSIKILSIFRLCMHLVWIGWGTILIVENVHNFQWSIYSAPLRHSRDFCLSGTIEMVNWAKLGALLFYLLRSFR